MNSARNVTTIDLPLRVGLIKSIVKNKEYNKILYLATLWYLHNKITVETLIQHPTPLVPPKSGVWDGGVGLGYQPQR